MSAAEERKASIEDAPPPAWVDDPAAFKLPPMLHRPEPDRDGAGACSSIACANCPKPGKCCEVLFLGVGTPHTELTALEFLAFMATVQQPGDTYGAPFMPLFKEGTTGRWAAWCPNLGRDGRCTDYANRPWTCRSYKPATNKGCALYRPEPTCATIWPWPDVETGRRAMEAKLDAMAGKAA